MYIFQSNSMSHVDQPVLNVRAFENASCLNIMSNVIRLGMHLSCIAHRNRKSAVGWLEDFPQTKSKSHQGVCDDGRLAR